MANFNELQVGHSHGGTASVSFQLLCLVNEETFCLLTISCWTRHNSCSWLKIHSLLLFYFILVYSRNVWYQNRYFLLRIVAKILYIGNMRNTVLYKKNLEILWGLLGLKLWYIFNEELNSACIVLQNIHTVFKYYSFFWDSPILKDISNETLRYQVL